MAKEDPYAFIEPSQKRIEDLSPYFIKSVSSVQDLMERFDRIFRLYIRPALAFAAASFQERPLLTVFASVFLILSFIPGLIYLVVSIATVTAFILGGVVSGVVSSIGAVLIYSTALISLLFLYAIISVFLTVLIVCSFSLVQLGILVRQHGIGGAALWVSDIKHYILSPHANSPTNPEANDADPSKSLSGASLNATAKEEPVESSPVDAHSSPDLQG